MERITKQQLARRLEQATGITNGREGLETLLYGWKKHRRFGPQYCKALLNRNWMYIVEVMDLSQYAGCDLTHPGQPTNA